MGINRLDKFGIYSVFLSCLQFRNRLAPSKNSHFAGRSRYSYFAQDDSGIAPAQSRNLDKVCGSLLESAHPICCSLFECLCPHSVCRACTVRSWNIQEPFYM